jgi:thioredoxin reductase
VTSVAWKDVVHVHPYVREGHPVSGYTRIDPTNPPEFASGADAEGWARKAFGNGVKFNIASGEPAKLRPALAALGRMKKQFPDEFQFVESVDLSKPYDAHNPNAVAWTDTAGDRSTNTFHAASIHLNEKVWGAGAPVPPRATDKNGNALHTWTDIMAESANDGFSVKAGASDPWGYTVTHEFGHVIEAAIAFPVHPPSREVGYPWINAWLGLGTNPDMLKWWFDVSKYGSINSHEAFAENFASMEYTPPKDQTPATKRFAEILPAKLKEIEHASSAPAVPHVSPPAKSAGLAVRSVPRSDSAADPALAGGSSAAVSWRSRLAVRAGEGGRPERGPVHGLKDLHLHIGEPDFGHFLHLPFHPEEHPRDAHGQFREKPNTGDKLHLLAPLTRAQARKHPQLIGPAISKTLSNMDRHFGLDTTPIHRRTTRLTTWLSIVTAAHGIQHHDKLAESTVKLHKAVEKAEKDDLGNETPSSVWDSFTSWVEAMQNQQDQISAFISANYPTLVDFVHQQIGAFASAVPALEQWAEFTQHALQAFGLSHIDVYDLKNVHVGSYTRNGRIVHAYDRGGEHGIGVHVGHQQPPKLDKTGAKLLAPKLDNPSDPKKMFKAVDKTLDQWDDRFDTKTEGKPPTRLKLWVERLQKVTRKRVPLALILLRLHELASSAEENKIAGQDSVETYEHFEHTASFVAEHHEVFATALKVVANTAAAAAGLKEPEEERGWKRIVHVHDYYREGHLVHGYDRTLADQIADLQKLRDRWADLDRQLLPYAGQPDHPEARRICAEQKQLCKQMHRLNLDKGGPGGVGLPGGPRDVVIVGAGPAGLSAAIYGGTEGLDTLLVDANPEVGGQARLSSRIENVLGFPAGIRGDDLAKSGLEQSQRTGATVRLGLSVKSIKNDPRTGLKTLKMSDGSTVKTRAVVVAGGVQFRTLNVRGAHKDDIVYGDSTELKKRCKGKGVVIVGGANSAGQAAIDTATAADHVTVLIRHGSISDGMSDYLVSQIDSAKNMDVNVGEIAEIVHDKDGNMTGVKLKDGTFIACAAVGAFIGSSPETDWAAGIERDEHGFIKTDQLQTNIPGVFAAGDVRANTIHRVITAAADGAAAIAGIHQFLAEQELARGHR